jgi:hypothetical protein
MSLSFMLGCSVDKSEDEALQSANGLAVTEAAQSGGERCATMKVLTEKIKENPGLLQKIQAIEAHTQRFEQMQKTKTTNKTGNDINNTLLATGIIEIPVMVNVLYNTSQQNISNDQIASQIQVLNDDFNARNADFSNIPAEFTDEATGMNYQFRLVDVVRKYSSKTSWGTRDAMKSAKKGGIDPTDPARVLNIWVCNIGGGTLGYAQFPGGPLSTDGVVIGPEYFGNTGYVSAPYNKGRTATHEVGHWLNLRHIWGDATCGSDLVSDTPTHNTYNFGCPSYPKLNSCSATKAAEMTMNYMDYTDDACMYMFSKGQKMRTDAIFAAGGPRNSFAK